MNILVTGGAGYIGSHAVRALLKEEHTVVVIDDLSHGHRAALDAASSGLKKTALFFEGSVDDRALVMKTIKDHAIEAVLHFAAFIEVGESVENPEKYYMNNFSRALTFFTAVKDAGVKKAVFSSTAAVYGTPENIPILESARRQPQNPYGRSKMMVELLLEDFSTAYDFGYAILRYFNVAGANEHQLLGEAHEPESHLIPRILAAAQGTLSAIGIFGTDYPTPDGTCVRDYVHVEDLVTAHLLALDAIEPKKGLIYNVGSESGFSVREVIAACSKVTGKDFPVTLNPRRAGDPPILVASSEKIRRELKWRPQFPELETIVRHAWKWHQSHPHGYHKN